MQNNQTPINIFRLSFITLALLFCSKLAMNRVPDTPSSPLATFNVKR